MGVFLAVAGNIGSGKSTLTRRLAERLGFSALYEDTQANPYLSDFYGDMQRYALPLQLRFLGTRVRQTKEVQAEGIGAIQDRTCYEDAQIFAPNLHARGALDGRDWDTYQLLSNELLRGLDPPDLLVFLSRSAELCRAQIRNRGRDYEQSMPAGYLEDLDQRYQDWFADYRAGPKLKVDGKAYDFLHSAPDLEALVSMIEEQLPQRMLPFRAESGERGRS
ncbi:MAG: deoxynucleoside kinase [Myxococcota bacterium]